MSQVKASETMSLNAIRALVRDAYSSQAKTRTRAKVRRQLIVRDADDILQNLTGTYLPAPFDKSQMAIKTMLGETAKAAQHYASRIAANTPKVRVTPESPDDELSATLDKSAGEQERLLDALWEDMGGRIKQWHQGMNMSITGAGYYLVLPRDADFGLPDRIYYDVTDERELASLRESGKIAYKKVEHPKTGQLVYAEHGDVWAARRQAAHQNQAQAGRSLFTLDTFPRDQVAVGKDKDEIKWAVIFEEVPGYECGPGSEYAVGHARSKGVPEDDVGLWGIWRDPAGRIVGGIEKGGPPESNWTRPNVFTVVRFFNRIEQVVLISASAGSVDGAEEVHRGRHGARKGIYPACPVVEVAMMHTGINVPGQEFTTPMEPVFAYVPIINQLLTILSNAAGFNGVPRWILELKDGTTLRDEDGEPVMVDNSPTPGLDPSEAAAYPGTLSQLLIKTDSLENLIALYMERLDACMPSGAAMGESGSSAAAWQVRLNIQQSQENLRQPVGNHALAVKDIFQMCQAWMRDLDMPVYFFSEETAKSGERPPRALITFHPKKLTDSIQVTQELDTPEEQTVRIQQGLELMSQGVITLREFFEDYLRVQDAREAEIEMYSEQVVKQVIYGTEFPPGSLLDQLAKGMQGELTYMLIQQSDNFAISMAEQMAQQSQMQSEVATGGAPPGGPPMTTPDGSQGVAQAAGVVEPGMGMNLTQQGQMGAAAPSRAPLAPVGG